MNLEVQFVDWECQNCGDYYGSPPDVEPQEPCAWCGDWDWQKADHTTENEVNTE